MENALARRDIARAVRRSRAARAAMQRRKLRLVAGACAIALAGSGAFLSLVGVTGSDAVAAAVQQAQSLTQLLDQRSPGERVAGAQTKHKKIQHALAKVRTRERPAGPSTSELAKVLMPTGPVGADAAIVPPVAIAGPAPQLADFVAPPAAPGGGPPIVGPGGSPGGSPGGIGGGGGSPGGPPIIYRPEETKTPVAAVPEPSTWAMMLLGFGLMGWRVRRTKARQHKLA
ncbi:PEPxxWA-CTERM sorting domain-containing protein [Sphingomonas flavescens]|uniref:PEPxxWA-CTERM sorting domain-containing protein n=1 Tax=Sphingomonas flavescens TaxID=3132797 RepID=UPI002805CBF3|nr:PEPxxWA-CTERM sorting domain-containing protein [Sphingomonas limnosediminicola]